MSQPHQSARNTIAPTVRKTPTPLTNEDRTVTSEVWIGSPAAVVTVMSRGKEPGAAGLDRDAHRLVLARFERDPAVGAVGEQQLVARERDVDRDALVGVVAERERDPGLAGGEGDRRSFG